MIYSQFSIEDFVIDKKFRQWVFSPDAENNLFWQSFLKRHPDKKETLQEAKTILLTMPRINYGWNSNIENHLWESIEQDMQGRHLVDEIDSEEATKVVPLHTETAFVLESSTNHPRNRNYKRIGQIAAVILLILSIGIATFTGSREDNKEQIIASFTKETPLGKKAKFVLPDGTKVVLNAGSTVSYPERFKSEERLVEVEGEAYFEVVKDSLRPFRVRTGAVVTEALGTAFNVLYEQSKLEIALVEGKVQVSYGNANHPEEELILLPGEQATLQNETFLVKDIFDVEEVTAWTKDVILFRGAREQEVINTLERWYGVNINIEGRSSNTWNFSGKFKDKSLKYVLKSVGYTMNFHFSIEKNKVKIIYNEK